MKNILLIGGLIIAAAIIGGKGFASFTGRLTIPQLWTLAKNAGFAGTDLVVAVAVALAESGGDPMAYGDIDIPVPGSASYGLWQINSHYHPEFGDPVALFDPVNNAFAAFSVYSAAGRSFIPWTTFKNGAYAAFMNQINLEA